MRRRVMGTPARVSWDRRSKIRHEDGGDNRREDGDGEGVCERASRNARATRAL